VVALALLALGCPTIGGEDEPRTDAGVRDAGARLPDAGLKVRVATFNVRRFFDTVCDTGQCGAGDYEALATPEAFDATAARLAAAISSFDADLVSLQELETQACLDALLAKLGPPWTGVLAELGAPASVDVAVLSRTSIDQVVLHRDAVLLTRPDGTQTRFSRELPEVHARVRGLEVVLFAAHFKSKSSDDPGRRLAEAQVARELVLDVARRSPGALVLLAGDLNDTPGSPPLEALTANGGLLRVAADLPVADQATYVWSGAGQAIDHVLQAPTAAAQAVPRASRVLREVSLSDHWPLRTEFLPAAP
jgi:endonuclease/exonuclease/phosphatase family metal-dependent hydrolase